MAERRSRRNAQQVSEAIRSAVRAEIAARGYHGLTFERVAQRADMNKSVLYRRFADRASLALDSLLGSGVPDALPGSCGDLRGDLIAWLTVAMDRATLLGSGVYRGIVGEAGPEVLQLVDGLVREVTSRMEECIIEPARRRGQLGPVPLAPVTVQAPLSALRDLMMFDSQTPHTVVDVVDQVAVPLYRMQSGLVAPPLPVTPDASDGRG